MKLRSVLMITLVLALSNLGLIYALSTTYNIVTESGYIRVNIDDVDNTFYDPDYDPFAVNPVFVEGKEIIEKWADANSSKIFIKDRFSFDLISYYYFPEGVSTTESSETVYGRSNNENIYNLLVKDKLIEEMYDTPKELEEELELMEVFEGNMFFPFDRLTRFKGTLYIDNQGESVLNLYDDLVDAGVLFFEDRNEILPKTKTQNIIDLIKEERIEDQAILISVIVNVFAVAFVSLMIVRNEQYERVVRRTFGLSRRRFMLTLWLSILLILLLTSVIALVMSFLSLNHTTLHYILTSTRFLILYNLLILIFIFLLITVNELRGGQNE